MASLNKINLIGNVGSNPEIRINKTDKVVNFSLAVNEKYTNANGNTVEKTEWFRVSVWGSLAEVAEKYVKKGSQIYVDGKLSLSIYTDKDGKDRATLEVRCSNLVLLGSANGKSEESADKQQFADHLAN